MSTRVDMNKRETIIGSLLSFLATFGWLYWINGHKRTVAIQAWLYPPATILLQTRKEGRRHSDDAILIYGRLNSSDLDHDDYHLPSKLLNYLILASTRRFSESENHLLSSQFLCVRGSSPAWSQLVGSVGCCSWSFLSSDSSLLFIRI